MITIVWGLVLVGIVIVAWSNRITPRTDLDRYCIRPGGIDGSGDLDGSDGGGD